MECFAKKGWRLLKPFFREIQYKPKRTRLSAIEHWLSKKPHFVQQRLDLLNEFVSEFGLRLERIYPEGEIVQDESLLLVLLAGVNQK